MNQFTHRNLARYICQNASDADFDQAFVRSGSSVFEPHCDVEWMREQIHCNPLGGFQVEGGVLWFRISLATFTIIMVCVPWSEAAFADVRKGSLRRTYDEMSAGYKYEAPKKRTYVKE
jgi:hypothetical protein